VIYVDTTPAFRTALTRDMSQRLPVYARFATGISPKTTRSGLTRRTMSFVLKSALKNITALRKFQEDGDIKEVSRKWR